MNPYRKQADRMTELIDTSSTGDEMIRLTRERRRYVAAAELIERNPDILIGELANGQVAVDMDRATEHPGSWGSQIRSARGIKSPKIWLLPPHDYTEEEGT